MDKFNMHKVKEKLSDANSFARKHLTETLTGVAILVGTISAWAHFFLGSIGWSIFFVAIGAILGIFFPNKVDQGLKKVYSFSFGEKKTSELIVEGIKIAIALFIPFIYFGFLGLMAGTAYHYYAEHMHKSGK